MMDYVTLIGIIAATLTTGASVPQLVKAIKTKQTEDISYYMYLFLTIGIFLWLIYGILDKDIPLIYANIFAMLIVYPIFILKIKNDVWKKK